MTEEIKNFIHKKPVILYNVESDDLDAFHSKVYRNENYSISIKAKKSKKLSKKSLALIKADNEYYLAWIKSKTTSSSVDRNLNFISFNKLEGFSILDFKNSLNGIFLSHFDKLPKIGLSRIPPKLSIKLLEYLWDKYENIIQKLINNNFHPNNERKDLQRDVIKLAISIATSDEPFSLTEVYETADIQLSNIEGIRNEDTVILKEMQIEREDMIISDLFCSGNVGKAVFKNSTEKLTIYLANKNQIEHCFGVDLIYINEIYGNIVMIQHKMMKKLKSGKWQYRADEQLDKEIFRMDKVAEESIRNKKIGSYRLNSDPFFIRLVRIFDGKVYSRSIPLEYFREILNSQNRKISLDEMGKRYLNRTELESLIRAGYIGTHCSDSEMLKKLINIIEQQSEREFILARKAKA